MYSGKFSKGFSLVELLCAVTTIGILAATAIPNYQEIKQRAFESVALSDYKNVKTAIFADIFESESSDSFIIFNQKGPLRLPSPLQEAGLSKNVTLNFALKANNIIAYQLTHDKGKYYHRFVDFNGSIIEQKIEKP